MTSLVDRVKASLVASGFYCGYKIAQEWIAVKFPGQPVTESSFYKLRRDLHNSYELPQSAYDKPPNKFSNLRLVVKSPTAVIPPKNKKAAPEVTVYPKKAAPEVTVYPKKAAPEVTVYPKKAAPEVTVAGVSVSEVTMETAVQDVTFAELMTVATVVKQLGAAKTLRALAALNELQTTILVVGK